MTEKEAKKLRHGTPGGKNRSDFGNMVWLCHQSHPIEGGKDYLCAMAERGRGGFISNGLQAGRLGWRRWYGVVWYGMIWYDMVRATFGIGEVLV